MHTQPTYIDSYIHTYIYHINTNRKGRHLQEGPGQVPALPRPSARSKYFV